MTCPDPQNNEGARRFIEHRVVPKNKDLAAFKKAIEEPKKPQHSSKKSRKKPKSAS